MRERSSEHTAGPGALWEAEDRFAESLAAGNDVYERLRSSRGTLCK
jgi:hypothetical protein